METKVNLALIGAFVLVLGAALVVGVLWFAGGGAYRSVYDTYLIYMSESVSGLNLDAPVRYRGVEVGRVRKMALSPANADQVQLTLDIERGTPVKEDTIAVLRVQGLTGIAYVELSGGRRESRLLEAHAGEDFPVIRSGPSLMVRLDSAVSALLVNLNATSENLRALLDEDNRREIKQSLADLRILTRTLAARSATIDSGLVDAAHTLNNTARLAAELPSLADRLQKSADGFDRMAAELARAGTRAGATLEGAREDLREEVKDTLPEIRLLAAELRAATASLRRFSEDLEQNPGVLLYGRPAAKRGPGE